MLLFVHVHGYAAAVVLNGYAVVFVNAYVDFGAETRQGFVDGVINHFIDQMVETAEIHVANIHGGTHPHCLETF